MASARGSGSRRLWSARACHRFGLRGLACLRFGVLFLTRLLLLLGSASILEAREPTAPIWLVSNGLHTSAGLRVQDLPGAREILGDRHADIALIGWGAHDYYRAHINPWTIAKAIFGNSSSL